VPVRQGTNAIFQNIPLIIKRIEACFIDFHSPQDVIHWLEATEDARSGFQCFQDSKKLLMTYLVFYIGFFYSIIRTCTYYYYYYYAAFNAPFVGHKMTNHRRKNESWRLTLYLTCCRYIRTLVWCSDVFCCILDLCVWIKWIIAYTFAYICVGVKTDDTAYES